MQLPPPYKYGLIAAGVLIAAYLLWLQFGAKPFKPGSVTQVATTSAVASMGRKLVVPRRLLVLTPKAEAVRRLSLPASDAGNPWEEIEDSVDVPATRYGATSTTFINVSSGLPRTEVRAKEAPWFSFLRNNTLGVEYGLGSKGRYTQGDYQRDVAQIKGVVVSGRASAKYQQDSPRDSEWGVAARLSWSW